MTRKNGRLKACERCSKPMYVQPNQEAKGEGRYCSRICKHQAMKGMAVPWAIPLEEKGAYITSKGYVMVPVERERAASGYIAEHRLVMEKVLGRKLETQEHVHHLNGDKADNRPENLRVMGNTEHQRLHEHLAPFMVRSRITLTCRGCGKNYETWPFKAEISHYCSHACRMKAMHQARREQAAERRARAG